LFPTKANHQSTAFVIYPVSGCALPFLTTRPLSYGHDFSHYIFAGSAEDQAEIENTM